MATPGRTAGAQCWRCLSRAQQSLGPCASPRLSPASTTLLRSQNASFTSSTSSRTQGQSPQQAVATARRHQPPPDHVDIFSNKNAATDAEESGEVDVKRRIEDALFELARSRNIPISPSLTADPTEPTSARMPRSVQTLYLAPLKRKAKHGVPTATLQLRSYSVRNLETMADFALRAAYLSGLAASGPVPLPKITERWTVPRSVFVHKKSQENFERVTARRLIQIKDGEPEVVQRWLAFIRKWHWYGVGMKANIWEYEALPEQLDQKATESKQKKQLERGMESVDWSLFGRKQGMEDEQQVAQLLEREGFGKATVSEALKAIGGEGGGAFSARQLKEGKKVRRTMDEEGDVLAYSQMRRDQERMHKEQGS